MRLSPELRERTKRYASAIVRLYVQLPRSRKEVEVLGHQLLRSGTSVAAQIRETSRARSDSEFCSKIDGALQEADESQLWLELLKEDCGISGEKIDTLHGETDQLIAIFVTMVSKTRRHVG
ncbi:MAG: four helix bundle protein [Chthoniobacterales bacterium]|nr:MAG: four helix bundle protein [Chthoniobacterales bacterium]